MIKYSILIPVYNVEEYLRECLESVRNQSYNDFEVIIINDGSKDNSLSICKEYERKDKRFHVFVQENQGLLISRKNALLRAKGEYCLFLDSDDYFKKELLQNINDILEIEKYDIIMFNSQMLYENKVVSSRPIIESGKTVISQKEAMYELLKKSQMNPIFLKAIRRDLLEQILEKAYIKLNYAEDLWQSFFLFSHANEVRILEKNLYVYRMRKSSLIHTVSMERIQETLKVEFDILNMLHNMSFDTPYNVSNFKIRILNEFLECLYRMNAEKPFFEQKKTMISLLNDNRIKEILKKEYIIKLPYYNLFRGELLKRRKIFLLWQVDFFLIKLQRILLLITGKKYFL